MKARIIVLNVGFWNISIKVKDQKVVRLKYSSLLGFWDTMSGLQKLLLIFTRSVDWYGGVLPEQDSVASPNIHQSVFRKYQSKSRKEST